MIQLESKISHQDFQIEKLVQNVSCQEMTLFQLTEKITLLTKQLKEVLELNAGNIRPNEKPPHY
jgi:SlyX protein